MMLKGANSNEVIENVKERITQIQQSLPEGVSIEPFLDRSELIAETTGTIPSGRRCPAALVADDPSRRAAAGRGARRATLVG